MASQELLKIQDSIGHIANIDSGNMLLAFLQGPVLAFFDERNFSDKTALEEQIAHQLADICATHG